MNKIKFPEGTIVIGGSGMTGYYIDDSVPNFDKVNGFDITKKGVIEKIFKSTNPKAVLLLAAETDVRKAEKSPLDCFDVNSIAPYKVAQQCKKYGSKLYFISSVDIFDGEKEGLYEVDDQPNPIVIYGESKNIAEGAIRAIMPEANIFRACWMFGGFERDKKFISYVVRDLKKGIPFMAVDDRKGTATYAKDLIKKLSEHLFHNRPQGETHQIACSGICGRYEEALLVSEVLGYGSVFPASSADFPNYRSLKNASLKQTMPSPSWQEALTEYITEWKEHE